MSINQTAITQPVLFIFEYALAKLLMHWGINPHAMIGHSIGEYIAAHLAGVFSLEDALTLVVLRGKLMQQMPPGAMLSVSLSEEVLKPLLDKDISLAAVNGPSLCVVSGNHQAIEAFAKKLEENGHESRHLHTSHAFHSNMMDPVLSEFKNKVTQVRGNEPEIPYISNVTGKWFTGREAADPGYWAIHLRKTVRFADGLTELLKEANTIFVEVGPGQVLSTLTRKQAKHINETDTGKKADPVIINLIPHPQEQVSDHRYLLTQIGQLWLYGQAIDWSAYYAGEKRSRISLPTYPFERQRYAAALERKTAVSAAPQKRPLKDWFYIPSWKRSLQPIPDNNHENSQQDLPGRFWLVFTDTLGLGAQLVNQLEKKGHQVISVKIGSRFRKVDDNNYTLNPHSSKDYDDLSEELVTLKRLPNAVLHLWNVTGANGSQLLLNEITSTLSSGFFSLLHIARIIGTLDLTGKIRVMVITDHMQEVVGGELLFPHKAALLGPVQVINREYPNIYCRSIDIVLPLPGTREYKQLVEQLLAEIAADAPEPVIAYRNAHRWCRTFEPVRFKESKSKKSIPRLKEKGVYLVTGGLGGIGLVLAEHLARSARARLILTGRSPLPPPSQWHQWVEEHENHDPISLKIKKVLELKKIGAEVMVFSSDVTNPEQMEAVVNRARERFGPINGVIHAAGVPDGAIIQRRTQEMSEEVLAPKIKGTLVLDHLLRDQELDFFMYCSSISSVLAPMGQAGYTAANAFLDAFAFYRTSRDNGFTVSVNWDIWQEVGMAVNVNSPKIPQVPQLQAQKLTHPLFHQYMADGMNLAIFYIKLSVNKHWFLAEHRVLGNALVVGTVYLELARTAFEVHVGKETVEIRQVYYLNPLMVAEDEEKELRVVLMKKGDYFEFLCATPGPMGADEWIPHARGEITAVDIEADPPKTHNSKDIENQCREGTIILAQEEKKPYDQGFIEVGPRWDSLIHVKLGKHQGLAWFQLPEQYTGDMKSYKLHPALLDYATSYLIMTNKHINVIKGGYLPFSYKRLRINGPLPTSMFCYSRFVENKSGERETLSFDVTIMDEQGNEQVDIKGFTLLTVMDEGKPIIQRARNRFPIPLGIFHLNRDAPRAVRPTASFIDDALKRGILPAEGIEVFDRIMGSNGTMPQILVCTQDLASLRQRINITSTRVISKETSHKKFTGTTQMRPALSSVYLAPRNKTEEILAQTLESYLGLNQVGVNDNFFELGASSLDMIQLSQKFTAAMGTEIPVVNLFRFPLISLLAEYLDRQGSKDNTKEKAKKRIDAVIDGRLGMKSRRQLITKKGGK